MTVATVLAQLKTEVAALAPSTGGSERDYAIPADVDIDKPNGGLLFDTLPVSIVAQRLGNDEGENRTAHIGANCFVHHYKCEVMIGLVTAETLNKQLESQSSVIVFSKYENQAQLWLRELHDALVANRTLTNTVLMVGEEGNGNLIEDYRIGYLPIDKPELWGLWASIPVIEAL